MAAWTFDELYGRNTAFLDGLDQRKQAFVGEVPCDFRGWVVPPRSTNKQRKKQPKLNKRQSSAAKMPTRRRPTRNTCEVRNLLTYSPAFREQKWQSYRIKDTNNGPEVWDIKWSVFWRCDCDGQPTRRHCLIVAVNVLTNEVKYFVANRVPGENGVTIRRLLRVAFGRWTIESCFRETKEELGLDHYEVRGWRCVHRHFYVTQLSHLFCARIRQEFDVGQGGHSRLSIEQVRSAMNVWLDAADLTPAERRKRYEAELRKQTYHRRRGGQARKSHTKTRRAKLTAIGIDVDRIKACTVEPQTE